MEWIRSDLCQNCFKNLKENVTSRWSSQISKKDLEQKLTGIELLVELATSQDERMQEEACVLAMILQRQKILIERKKEVKQEETSYTLYECRSTGDILFVPHAELSPQSLKEIQVRLEEKCRLKAT